MKASINQFFKFAGAALILALLGILFSLRASQNFTNQNFRNSNFFVLWLSGRLIADGGNPYDPVQWKEGHAVYGATIIREPTFLYPLPVAVFLAPIGLLSVDQAYLFWQFFCQAAIAFVVFALLRRWQSTADQRLLLPITLFLLFFGPIYLTLQIGSLGPLTLLLMLAAIHLMENKRSFLVGILLSLTMLKPPQGITILALVGSLLVMRRDWKAISGIVIGGFLLWMIGIMIDPNWVGNFQHSSQAAFDRRLGVQSTIWSFSYLACSANIACYYVLGTVGMLLLLGTTGYYLWRGHKWTSPWEEFNIIIPIAFVSTIYLWAYDQILYVIPIVWIIGTLVERTKSYIYAFIFLTFIDLYSLFALAQQATTGKDLWSLGTTLIVFGTGIGLLYLNRKNKSSRQYEQ